MNECVFLLINLKFDIVSHIYDGAWKANETLLYHVVTMPYTYTRKKNISTPLIQN